MTAYEELLEFGGERIFDFLKNARLHESQFKYSEFNEVCYKKMYIENNQDSIKTVKELKEEIPELKDTCKGCGSYFMNPRNKSIKGLDVQFGRLLEDVIIDFLKTKYKLNVTHGDNSNKKYPDCMLLSGDKGMRYILRVYFRQRISMLELLVEKTREKTLLNSFLDELQNMYIIIRSGMSIKLMSLQEISILILMI